MDEQIDGSQTRLPFLHQEDWNSLLKVWRMSGQQVCTWGERQTKWVDIINYCVNMYKIFVYMNRSIIEYFSAVLLQVLSFVQAINYIANKNVFKPTFYTSVSWFAQVVSQYFYFKLLIQLCCPQICLLSASSFNWREAHLYFICLSQCMCKVKQNTSA